jgi:periplasmic protein CpxP/Spy
LFDGEPLREEVKMSKFCWSTLTILVVLVTGLLLAGQTNPAPQTSPQGHEAMGPPSPEAHVQMLSEKLNLTEDQKTKLKPIFQDQEQQLKAVRDDSSLTPEQKAARKKAIHEATHDQINAVLTPEQQQKFKEMKKEAMEKHKDMTHQ